MPLPGQKVFIQVSIYEEAHCLVLAVQDISRGMEPEKLAELRRQLADEWGGDKPGPGGGAGLGADGRADLEQDSGAGPRPGFHKRNSGYGLYNVNQRIHIYYGGSYGLTITSERDFGTEVSLRIPRQKGDDPLVPGNAL